MAAGDLYDKLLLIRPIECGSAVCDDANPLSVTESDKASPGVIIGLPGTAESNNKPPVQSR